MYRCILLLSLFIVHALSQELLVIGDKNFLEENLTKEEIKAIFLDKKRFLNQSKILVMNHKPNHYLRICFEKYILEKSQQSLERYWRKAYYKGRRPPKIISSTEMLFSYLEYVQPSIGYIDANRSVENITFRVLYQIECDAL